MEKINNQDLLDYLSSWRDSIRDEMSLGSLSKKEILLLKERIHYLETAIKELKR